MKKTVIIGLMVIGLLVISLNCLAGNETDEINDLIDRYQTATINKDIPSSLACLAYPYQAEDPGGEARVFSEAEMSTNLATTFNRFTFEGYEFQNRQIMINNDDPDLNAVVTCDIFTKIESREFSVPLEIFLVKQNGWKIKKITCL